MRIMSRILCNKILLPNTAALEIIKSHSIITFYFVKRCAVHSSVVQYRYQKIEATDVNFENLAEKNDKLFPIISDLQNANLKSRNKILQNYVSFNISYVDLYLINRKEGERFVALIKDDLFENMSHVIEVNPGFGLLTENLLEAGVPFLTLYERYSDFYPNLYNLYMKYPKRFVLKSIDLIKLSKTLNSHCSTDNIDITKLLENVPEKKWEESTCMQIVGTVTNASFLKYLIICTLFQTSFMSYGRPTFYFATSPFIWNKLTKRGCRLNTTYIMFNTLFDYKIFGTLDRNAFFPWQKRTMISKKNTDQNSDYHVLYVIKLEPKSNVHTMFGKKENLIHFWYFIRHHCYTPSRRVIPSLEKQVPGCGVRLIKKNYTIFTEFRELSLTQLYDLFMEFQSWPEYQASTLILGASEMRKTYSSHIKQE